MDVDEEPAGKFDSFIIKATNVPLEFFQNRDVAKRYFRRFGKVKLVMFKPKRFTLLIEYANEDSMLNALDVAGEYNGHVFKVTRDTETVLKKKKTKKNPDPDWTDDPDVKAELEAMGAFGVARTYDLRSEAMSVDPVEVTKNKPRRWKSASASPKPQKKKTVIRESISAEHSELVHIVRQQALSIEDKFKILDARDKLIRIKLKNSIELSKTTATVGTCPDMCPEKERLMRETQHQVALYEQAEGGKGMNARLAVKQYSRSSADQEAPLPQELRPVSVLQMTMGYLMHRIMNLCDSPDVNIAEWYHFLWDRTRGIRKDITQQELCCQGSVALVEQCARFHIFCSARLVSEDPSVFDQKINTENLTKCLQTLKYMYHDLQLKGESCKNEPEFRAYIILLNLNDGNFMWEVQQLRKEIQQSKEVKFALEVYSSLDKRNYVKFFKLVNSTTHLNACILMRYFIQVRLSAIKTLLKSYSPRVSQTSFPVSHLTKILAFESLESTIEFVESYGLTTNIERNRIILDKPSFSDPEYPYVLDRAINLVESKRNSSIGEVVCGRELPPKTYENHVPQDSFDEEGYLTVTPDVDEVDSVAKKEETKIEEQKEKIDDPPKILSSRIASPNRSQNIFAPSVQKIFTPAIQNQNVFAPVSQSVSVPSPSQNIFAPVGQNQKIFGTGSQNENVFALAKQSDSIFGKDSAAKSAFTKPEKTEQSVFGKGEKSVFGKTETDSGEMSSTKSLWATPPAARSGIFGQKNIFGGEIVPSTPLIVETPKLEVTRSVQAEVDEKRVEEESKRRRDEEAKRKKEEEIKREELKKRLEQERKRLEEAKALAVKKKMIEEQQKRIQQERRKNVEIKAAVSNLIDELLSSVEEEVKRVTLGEISRRMRERRLRRVIAKWRENTRRKRKRKAIDFNPSWCSTMTVREEAEELSTKSQSLTVSNIKRYKRGQAAEIEPSEDDITKIDLSELTHKLLTKKCLELDMKLHQELFWKVTISLPDELECKSGLNHIERVLDGCIKWTKKGSTTVTIEQSKFTPTVTYCLERQKGLLVNSRNDTNGFIFVANDFSDDLRERIIQNFRNFGVFVKVPVVLALQTYTENKSHLKALLQEGIISDYLIIVDKFTSKNLVNMVEEALIFLSTRIEKTPPLEMDTLKSFLTKHLCCDIWKRANSFAKWNSNYKNCLKNPNSVIYLYNEALDRLKAIVLDDECTEHSRFPQILKEFLRSDIPDSLPCDYKYFPNFWDNATYRTHIESVLDQLRLPSFLVNWPPRDQLELEDGISKYCAQIVKNSESCFYRTMSVLLKYVDSGGDFHGVREVLWTDVVELLALEKLNQTNFSLYGTGFVNQSVYNQLVVVYNVNSLGDYVRSDWFYINNPVIKQKIFQFLGEAPVEMEVEKEVVDDLDIDEILDKITQPRNQNVGKIKNEMRKCKKLLTDLEDSVVVHKRILEKSGHLLKSLIEDN